MKVKLNPVFEQVSGQFGEMVFRELRGETIVSRKPILSATVTENQLEHRERFRQAAAYGKAVLANPTTRELYEEAAKNRNMPVFAMTIADFFNAPVVDSLDLSAFAGQAGGLIHMSARDDFGVVSVHVSVATDQGAVLESGTAVETAEGSGHWVYTATTNVPGDTNIVVNVVATDRPSGTAVKAVNQSF